jgi:hypothetical protein
MPISTQLPDYFTPRVGDRPREVVEVQLAPDTVDLDIIYGDRNSNKTSRRIKPVALTVLANSELALIAICRLRQEQRCFALNRIIEASFPGFPSKPLTGEDLMEWLQPDVKRLIAHDATVNGISIQKARPYQEVVSFAALAEMEISRNDVPIAAVSEEDKSVPAKLADLAREVYLFATATREKSSRKQSAVTVTLERRDGNVRVHVDTTKEVAQHIRDGSNHARMAFLKHKSSIENAGADLYASLCVNPYIGHDNMTVRLVLQRGAADKSTGLWLSLDNNWINQNPNAASTLSTKIGALIRNMAKHQEITEMGEAPAEWLVDTLQGIYRIHAPRAEEVIPRLMTIGLEDTLHVLAVAQIVNPVEPMRRHVKTAA